MTFPENEVAVVSCKKNTIKISELSTEVKIYVINTPFCVDFLLFFVLQSSPTEIPLKWPALRNNKSPQVGQAKAWFRAIIILLLNQKCVHLYVVIYH